MHRSFTQVASRIACSLENVNVDISKADNFLICIDSEHVDFNSLVKSEVKEIFMDGTFKCCAIVHFSWL